MTLLAEVHGITTGLMACIVLCLWRIFFFFSCAAVLTALGLQLDITDYMVLSLETGLESANISRMSKI